MDIETLKKELARQDAELAKAMKAVGEMQSARIAVPEEALRALDTACERQTAVAPHRAFDPPGIRA